jgi:hypothetical protein
MDAVPVRLTRKGKPDRRCGPKADRMRRVVSPPAPADKEEKPVLLYWPARLGPVPNGGRSVLADCDPLSRERGGEENLEESANGV